MLSLDDHICNLVTITIAITFVITIHHPLLDSIDVSVFADIFIELTNTVMAAGEESFMCLSSMKSA